MFVRVKTTPNSPRKSVQIVESVRKGEKITQKIVRHVGIAMDDAEVEELKRLAECIRVKIEAENNPFLFAPEDLAREPKKPKIISENDYKVDIRNLREEARVVNGIHDVYGKLFDETGLDKVIANPARHKNAVQIFRDVVLARIANPMSKMASIDMLEEDFGVSIDLQKVYRMMDLLDDKAVEKLNAIAYENTKRLCGGKIDVIFYDATTIYFESFTDDDLRKCGFSKDLKFNQPQVLLALMVTKDGQPIGYKLFPGNEYEGHTLMPALADLKSRFDLDKVVFVADSGLFSKMNVAELERNGFEYIVGARLKSMPDDMTCRILDPANYSPAAEGMKTAEFKLPGGRRLVVSHSEKRAAKDAADRMKAIDRLKAKLEKDKSVKGQISNHGYKKYLDVVGGGTISINADKIAESARWDGLHGMMTNCADLTVADVLAQYKNLWQVEDSFRVTKHDLKVRPVFHWKPGRVRAHIAISFAAYCLVRHLEHRVRLQHKKMSAEEIRKNLMHVQTSVSFDATRKIRYGLPSAMSQDARKIYRIMRVDSSRAPYVIEKM